MAHGMEGKEPITLLKGCAHCGKEILGFANLTAQTAWDGRRYCSNVDTGCTAAFSASEKARRDQILQIRALAERGNDDREW